MTGFGRGIPPSPVDAVKIVPLFLPEETRRPLKQEGVQAPAPPQLTYRGGPLMTNVEVFTIFWGAVWQAPPLSTTAADINDFFTYVLTSPLIDQLSEYGVPGTNIGHGRLTGTTTALSPHPRRVVTDRTLQTFLQHEIATNVAFPQPSANTLYFIYTPPGVTLTQGGSSSCQAFCGYHNDISGQIFYAAMPYPGCQGCTGNLNSFDALTSTSSHELCEAITDPIPGQGWYDDINGEIGDICAWKTKQLDKYTVQLEWSNTQGQCI